MELRSLSAFATLGLVLTLAGCTKEPKCLIADSLVKIESKALDKQQLQLFLRTSGFQDKVQFYEIYENAPQFGSCGQSNIDALSQVYIDPDLGHPKILAINDDEMSLTYTKDQNLATQVQVNIQ